MKCFLLYYSSFGLNKGGLKAQWSTQPRASEATPWVTDCHSIDALKGQKHSMLEIGIKLLPLQGATAPTRDTQGVASLALGYVLHWAFSPPLLNPKLLIVLYLTRIQLPYFIFHVSFLCHI